MAKKMPWWGWAAGGATVLGVAWYVDKRISDARVAQGGYNGLGRLVQRQAGQPTKQVWERMHAYDVIRARGEMPVADPHSINHPFLSARIQPRQAFLNAQMAQDGSDPYAVVGPLDFMPNPDLPTQQEIVSSAMHGAPAQRPPALYGPTLQQAFWNVWE